MGEKHLFLLCFRSDRKNTSRFIPPPGLDTTYNHLGVHVAYDTEKSIISSFLFVHSYLLSYLFRYIPFIVHPHHRPTFTPSITSYATSQIWLPDTFWALTSFYKSIQSAAPGQIRTQPMYISYIF